MEKVSIIKIIFNYLDYDIGYLSPVYDDKASKNINWYNEKNISICGGILINNNEHFSMKCCKTHILRGVMGMFNFTNTEAFDWVQYYLNTKWKQQSIIISTRNLGI